jgi:energy-coupling factor transporter ATP-binding protein EcfA2
MSVPVRFKAVTFDSYEPKTHSQAQALRAVQDWIAAIHTGPLLALVGKQGTGKTHLLYSALARLLEVWAVCDPKTRGAQPFVAPWYKLSDELRFGRTDLTDSGSRQLTAGEVRARLWERRVVLLDEVRPTSWTHFDDTELAKFACHAYDNRIAVLITTNWNPLAGVMGDAAASRFASVIIDGPDARQQEAA